MSRTEPRDLLVVLQEHENVIARIWSGVARADDAAAYASYIHQTGIEG